MSLVRVQAVMSGFRYQNAFTATTISGHTAETTGKKFGGNSITRKKDRRAVIEQKLNSSRKWEN